MTGWCPIHDRVYDAADALCPRCGTMLVPVDEDAHASREIPGVVVGTEDDPRGDELADSGAGASAARSEPRPTETVTPLTLAMVLVAAVVVAFLAGQALPRGPGDARPNATAKPHALADYKLKADRPGGGTTLRLERFTQRGRRLTVRVSVRGDWPLGIGTITDVVVIPLTGKGAQVGRYSMPARITTSGFVLDAGVLERADIPVVGIELFEITSTAEGGVDIPFDVSRVWPPGSGLSPRAMSLTGSARAEDGRTFRPSGAVGWPDRLEIGLRIDGLLRYWDYDDRYSIKVIGSDAAPLMGEVSTDIADGPVRHAVFRGLPASARRIQLSVRFSQVTIRGGWRWIFR